MTRRKKAAGKKSAATSVAAAVDATHEEKKWGVIMPWVAQLRAVAEVTLALDSTRRPVVFVHVLDSKCGDQWRERLVQCREAMELMAMVGAADNAAWIELLHHDVGCDNALFARARGDPVTPRFWLSFNHKKEGEVGVDDAVRFLHFFGSEKVGSAGSDQLKRAREEILRQCSPEMLRNLQVYERFEIDVKFQPPAGQSEDFVREYLTNTRTLVGLLAKCATNASSSGASEMEEKHFDAAMNVRDGFPFKPRFVELELSNVTLPSGTATLVAEIAAKGVCLGPGIDFSDNTVLGHLSIAELGQIALAVTNHSSSDEGQEATARPFVCEGKLRCGYRDVVRLIQHDLAAYPSDNYKCEAVFSSLLASRDVSHVYMQAMFTMGSRNDNYRKWQWLAYALFSNESTSSVTNLVIDDMDICESDVAAITSILKATNPVEMLLSRQVRGPVYNEDDSDGDDEEEETILIAGEAPTDFVSIILSAGTSIAINPADSAQTTPNSLVLRADSNFRVIRKDDSRDVIDFLAPGFGHCSVPRASVTQFVTIPQPTPSSSLRQGYKGKIKSLELRFMIATDASTLLPLITYLGPQLEELKLQGSIPVRKQALRAILEACPRLQKLQLPQTEPGFEVELLSAFERNSCMISSLEVDAITPGKDTMALIGALQDPSTLVAATLRHISFVPSHRVFDNATASAFLDVLKANSSLESLTLALSVPVSKQLKEKFLEFDKQLLPVMKTPLPYMCQLAFLSAVRRLQSSGGEGNEEANESRSTKRRRVGYAIDLDRMDRGVASLIFAFAAERKARSVSIRTFRQ
ncbi:hypothetical protein Gpo141_00013893 [Globisporangium polare]